MLLTRTAAFLCLNLCTPALLAQTAGTAVTETHFGITTVDDYRWMEQSANADRLGSWMKDRSAVARAGLSALPKRAAFAARLKEVSSGLSRYGSLQTAGGTAIYRFAKAGDRTPKLFVRQNGQDRLLFDPDPGAGKPVRAPTSVHSRTMALPSQYSAGSSCKDLSHRTSHFWIGRLQATG
jgi:prolyl oligopeptidase